MAIIGGGLIGCSIALELSRENLRIVVLDKQEFGRESSWAAAGMLSPAPESSSDSPLVPLARESVRIYPEFVRAIENESGKSCGYAHHGTLLVFAGDDATKQRDETIVQHRRLGLTANAISLEEAKKKGLSKESSAHAVAFLEDEGTIDPRLLMGAVLAAAERRGVQLRAHCEVKSLAIQQHRCVGVNAKQPIAAKHVVLAAGCFSGSIAGNSVASKPLVPTRPVRGQLAALKCETFRLERVIRSERGYLVPRKDGRIIAGSTIEEAGFQKRVTAIGIRDILETSIELCPDLREAEVIDTWCGLRPGTPDALPILGPARSQA